MLFNKHKNFLNQQAILILLKGNDDCLQQNLKLYLFIKHFMKKREKRKHNLYLVFAITAATMPPNFFSFFSLSQELIYTLC